VTSLRRMAAHPARACTAEHLCVHLSERPRCLLDRPRSPCEECGRSRPPTSAAGARS
jgi:hypothetical protein